MHMRSLHWVLTASALFSLCLGVLNAADSSTNSKSSKEEAAQEVELFAAMQAGDIEVKVVPKDSTGGQFIVKNKTDKPLTIKLPEAFAGVPVAAQFGGGGFGGGGGNQFGGGGGGGNQSFGGGGGGFGGGGGGGFGGGGGGGGFGNPFMNVPAGKEHKVKFVAVCLEHGKNDPNPRVPYTIKPIEKYTQKPETLELLKMMGRGEIDPSLQHALQAAIWHAENGLSYEEMAAKIGVKHRDGSTEPYFQAADLQKALAMTAEVAKRVEEQKKNGLATTPGKEDSLSSKK
jgi:hypothetical protein